MERRAKCRSSSPNKASLIMVFFSCIASLYVAGRLWEDAENRSILSELVRKNSGKLPKVMTTEDKLMYLGCKDLGRRLVEAEMDLTLAKSQGFLHKKDSSSSGKKLLAVIGVYTGFGGGSSRNSFRSSWIPNGDALRRLQEKGVIVRFIVGRSANRGDSLDRNIDAENASKKDFFILEGHEEASEELPKKTKFFFGKAVETWDADFYVKVDDNVKLDLDGLVDILKSHRGKSGVYMGCMKSGEVVSEQSKMWYEPEWWKFGDEKSYFRHAAGSLFVLSKNLAHYIGINSGSLQAYAHDDISVGSWMIGLETTYIDETRLCCSSSRQDKVCSIR